MYKINMDHMNNEKGQTLLFVVVALTVALAVGMSVSQRTISSVRRSTNTDTSSRVYTASEGGIEWFLRQPEAVLTDLSDGNNSGGSECPAGTTDFDGDNASCVISFTSATGDNIQSRAIVSVSSFIFNNPANTPDHYWFNLNSGEVKEVRLTGFSGNLRVCWNGQDGSTPDLYYSYYNNNGIQRKAIIQDASGTNTGNEGGTAGLIETSVVSPYIPTLDFQSCRTLNLPSGLTGIRIKAMYGAARVGVFDLSAGSDLPNQGFLINSIGELFQDQQLTTTKRLRVFRSFSYMPSVFDYAIYSGSPLGL